jgi:L-ascorbate metabolism protein UlaG (beta-lactamase superfamily)
VRLLTDPTFDPAGKEYPTGLYTLKKLTGPAAGPESLGQIDVVLLSHDHHFDNLERAGRDLLQKARAVVTTEAGAARLGGQAMGLAHWQSVELPTPDGHTLRIVGTPARHGPAGGDRGPVIGFIVALTGSSRGAIYLSGDTVWYEGVAEVSRRFRARVVMLFMGAARVPEVGPSHLTFTAAEAVEAARAFPDAIIIPLHYEGWAHFSESRQQVEETFAAAGLSHRLSWLNQGRAASFTI